MHACACAYFSLLLSLYLTSSQVYRARRGELATIAKQYSLGEPIPHIVYTEQEIATWGAVYDRLGVGYVA
jgi:hypothetical protein